MGTWRSLHPFPAGHLCLMATRVLGHLGRSFKKEEEKRKKGTARSSSSSFTRASSLFHLFTSFLLFICASGSWAGNWGLQSWSFVWATSFWSGRDRGQAHNVITTRGRRAVPLLNSLNDYTQTRVLNNQSNFECKTSGTEYGTDVPPSCGSHYFLFE